MINALTPHVVMTHISDSVYLLMIYWNKSSLKVLFQLFTLTGSVGESQISYIMEDSSACL